ncbi:hypothetical protein [Enterobacter sp.]|uniref:hypothetical protein n=1 Tax=Enterobacter sp. TaxID=42895 RepID=UPI00296EE237|nr:hypothetical protein [Enterobacter sp.]
MSDDKDIRSNLGRTPNLRVIGGSGFEATFGDSPDRMQNSYKTPVYTERRMDNLSREELDARLAANKSEVDAIASEMRREMAEFRAFQAQQFSTMNSSMSEIKAQISGVNGEVTGLKGQIDGLKTTSATLQWMVGAILALLAVILALPQMQSFLKPVEITQSVNAPAPSPAPAPGPTLQSKQ